MGKETLAANDTIMSTILTAQECSLVVVDGPHEGMVVPLDRDSIRIGRAEWCDVILEHDPKVSTIHCECAMEEGGVRIRDLRSKNGIFLNGCKVFDAFLAPETKFQVGNTTLQLMAQEGVRSIPISYHDQNQLLVGKSRAMRSIFSMISKLSKANVNTLLTGETGVGKTTVARAIHLQSDRASRPFVTVNCAALPANLIESQLFGFEKGAFTGAEKTHLGFFEQANGGTLLLDEIAELPLELQPKLLDVIERQKVRRLGGEEDIELNVRLISATHQDPVDMLEMGLFREDLYFRLSVVALEIPPLRERVEDIPMLTQKLLQSIEPSAGFVVTEAAVRLLQQQLWPGNIRQLRNILEYTVTFNEGPKILKRDLKQAFTAQRTSPLMERPTAPSHEAALPIASSHEATFPATSSHPLLRYLPEYPLASVAGLSLKNTMESLEKELVSRALTEAGGNAQEAADILGISIGWIYNRCRKYDIATQTKARKKTS